MAINHARYLADHFDVTLISDSLPETPIEGIRNIAISPHRFRWMRRFGHVPADLAFGFAAARSLVTASSEEAFDLVEFHGHSAALIAGSRVRDRFRSRVAMVTHGDIFDRPPGSYDARLTAYYRYVSPRAYRSVDCVIALSPAMSRFAVRGGADPATVAIVPNGVDLAAIGLHERTAVDFPSWERLELLYVGRISVEKGIDSLVTAAELALDSGCRLRLRIAGGGPLEEKLRARVSSSLLSGHVEFLGSWPRNQLADLYQSAHIVCVPSLSDPLPTVVLEAMFCGRPVLGADVGGIPFMIENDGGWTVPAGNPRALADRILDLAADRGAIEAAGRAAQAIACRRFQWPIIVRELACVLNKVISSASSRTIGNVR